MTRHPTNRSVGASARWIGPLTAAVAALGAVVPGTEARAVIRTQAIVFRAFTASGKPSAHVGSTVRGSCWTGSLAIGRADAWRCMTGNEIIDPCFSSPRARGVVLCPASGPWGASLIEIKLTKALPRKYGNHGALSTNGLPWALTTTAGWRCQLATGATTVVHGSRLNYFCTGTKTALWGAPSRRSQLWRIYAATPSAKVLRQRVAIRSVWF